VGNPFNPGAGRKPPYLAGRGEVPSSVKTDMRRVYEDSEGMRPVIVSGLRGMGKTVLLRELDDFARSQGWVAIWVEASTQRGTVDRPRVRARAGRPAVLPAKD